VLAVAGTAQFMVILDVSIVNVALPSIQADLGFSQQSLQWVVSAYTIAFAGFQLLGGRAADLFGQRRVLLAGLGLFTLASLAGGLAANQPMLVVARAIQGLGSAVVAPATLTIVTSAFPEGAERNRALGIWGSMLGAGGTVGVLAGGVLTELLSWHWIFLVNVPIGLAVALAALRWVPEERQAGGDGIDVLGALTVTGGLIALVSGIVNGEQAGWVSPSTLGTFGLAGALLVAFALIEARVATRPLVPLRVLRVRSVTGANLVVVLIGASLISMWFFLSLYLQAVLGYSPLKAGFAFLPMSLVIVAMTSAASRLVARVGVLAVLVTGLLLVAAGLAGFTRLPVDGSWAGHFLLPSLLASAGLGLTLVSSTVAAMAGARPDERGLASGLLNTSRLLGGALGLAVLSTVASTRAGDLLAVGHPRAAALTGGFHLAFALGAGMCLGGAVLALVLLRGLPSQGAA
jgi:EmrB/QacA subfamily drug resistance transporter